MSSFTGSPFPGDGLEGQGLFARIVRFGRELRAAGLPVSPQQSRGLARGLRWIDPLSRTQFYWAARALLVYRKEDLELFARLFERFWGYGGETGEASPRKAPRAPRHRPRTLRSAQPLMLASMMAARASAHHPEREVADRSRAYSSAEVLQRKDFARMSEEERQAVRRLLLQMDWDISRRRSRRRIADRRRGQLDLRKVLRQASRQDGKVIRLPRRRRKIKPRPLVLIADVSGSMELYARLLLQFFHVISLSSLQVESFVFATRLTRITNALGLRHPEQALQEVAEEVFDFAGGTRIGECLGRFNRRWARRVLRRGAVVMVASDGCDRGDPEQLKREVQRLRRSCHRLIWLNPRLGQASYQPLAQGMATALPLVDDFLPVHNLRSLQELARHLQSLSGVRARA
ncbi:MAG TPA: VWA domain-containing protein [Acidobacteriota bacterium]|nr:VWA domain-containing protein [Acidobacteriota bacterium]